MQLLHCPATIELSRTCTCPLPATKRGVQVSASVLQVAGTSYNPAHSSCNTFHSTRQLGLLQSPTPSSPNVHHQCVAAVQHCLQGMYTAQASSGWAAGPVKRNKVGSSRLSRLQCLHGLRPAPASLASRAAILSPAPHLQVREHSVDRQRRAPTADQLAQPNKACQSLTNCSQLRLLMFPCPPAGA